MLQILLGLINPIAAITEKIVDLRAKQMDQQTERERIATQEEIEALKAKQAVLVAESNTPVNSLVRAWLVAPPSIYVAKLFVWDKVLGWGTTDNLSDNLWWIVFVIYGFYFVTSTRFFKR